MAAKTREIEQHWSRVAELGCIVCDGWATIAHCHGGSISDELGQLFRPGMAQKQNHWLVIPLCKGHHQGNEGLDTHLGGVRDWEEAYGTQVEHLEEVSYRLGYCCFRRAGITGYRYQFVDPPEGAAEPEPSPDDALAG